MKIIHFGDLHVWRRMPLWSELHYPKRWLGPLNLVFNRAKKFPPGIRESALREICRQQPDVAVFTGDFSSFSLKSEFEEAGRLFASLRELLGERLFAIPGNHDVYTAGSVRKQVLEKALPWVHTDPVTRLDLTESLTLLGVNHSIPFLIASNGQVSPETQTKLEEAFLELEKEGRQTILAGHFPYVSPPEYPEARDHKLLDEVDFSGLIRKYRPRLYLHGHQHIRWAFRSDRTPDTLCLNCGSVAMRHDHPEKQAGFLSWDQQDDGSIRNLTAHTYNGRQDWVKSPLQER